MPYSEADLNEIDKDPSRLRAYYWHMAMHWQRLARLYRETSRTTGELHPVTNYRGAFDEGYEKVRWAGILEAGSALLLSQLDEFVASTQSDDDDGQ